MPTLPFEIHAAMRAVTDAVRAFPKAALFELADDGYNTPFQQLVACIISIRTRDEVTLPVAGRLFARASTPEALTALTVSEIDQLIGESTFHARKAEQLHHIASHLVDAHRGSLPCDRDLLLGLPGVGPKCAHLVLGIACGESQISVDIHVHRVTNRWGYIRAKDPQATTAALEAKLPREYWIEINRLLVPFGKHICTGRLPRCSECPVRPMCAQVGVEAHR